jgi:hypothetical protein
MPRRREELPMFARQHIGPAAELGHLNLLAEVIHERQLVQAATQETSPDARSGGSFSTMALNRIVHAARALLALHTTDVVGTGYPSRPH